MVEATLEARAKRSQLRLIREMASPEFMRSTAHAARRSNGSYSKREKPLTEDDLIAHLTGGTAVSCYPLVRDRCRIAVFDMDYHEVDVPAYEHRRSALQRLRDEMKKAGVTPMIFQSGGGHGFHLIVAYKDWAKAQDVRTQLTQIAEKAGLKIGTSGISEGQVELIPKSGDAGAGFGSCISLPLARSSLPIDLTSLQPLKKSGFMAPELGAMLNDLPPPASLPSKRTRRARLKGHWTVENVSELLEHISPDDYDVWTQTGMSIHHQFGEDGFDIWLKWSETSTSYVSEADCRARWNSFDGPSHKRRLTIRSLIKRARDGGWRPPASDKTVLDRVDPRTSAEAFIKEQYTDEAGAILLVRYQDQFYVYSQNKWSTLTPAKVRSEVGAFLARCEDAGSESAFKPRSREVREIIDFIADLCLLEPGNDISPPFWRSGSGVAPPEEMVMLKNGILHVITGMLYPSSPDLFSLSSSPFWYDENTCPPERFLAFLKEIWPDDDASVQLLQEWMGLIITMDSSFQKILLLIGARRGGKSTIASLFAELIAPLNVVATDFVSLGSDFGMEALINATVVIMPDARATGGRESNRAVARLNACSGEDLQHVNRKGKIAWSGVLRARFVIVTNEAPRVTDHSQALGARFMPLVFERSFAGREDATLRDRLRQELPQIFHWALGGYKRLKAAQLAQQHPPFTVPKSSGERSAELQEMMSPISDFVGEYLEFVPGQIADRAATYDLFRSWCGLTGIYPLPSMAEFVRELLALAPQIRATQLRSAGNRRVLVGVVLIKSQPF